MAAITDKISKSKTGRVVSSLFNKLEGGSAESSPESEKDRQIQASLDAVRNIGDTVSSTATALNLLQSKTNVDLVEINSTLLELDVLSNRILDPSDEVNEDDATRFNELSDKIDTLIAESKDIKVTDDATLNDFLIAFEKKKGEVTLASRSIGDEAAKASEEIGGNFSEFLSENISSISTTELGAAATDVAISTLAGPLAPIVQSLTGLIDVDKLTAGAKGLFEKGKGLAEKLRGKQQAEELVSDKETLDDSPQASIEVIAEPLEILAEVNQAGFKSLLEESDDDDEPTAEFREEQAERIEAINDTLEDKLEDVEDAVGDIESGSGATAGILAGLSKKFGGLISGVGAKLGSAVAVLGKVAGPVAAVAAAGAIGFGIGTIINDQLNDLTDGGFGESIGDAIGPGIDTILGFFGDEAAKDRLALTDALNAPQERKDNASDALSDLTSEATSTGFLGLGGFDVDDFREISDELKGIREGAEAPERVDLINQQIQTLATSLADEDTTVEAREAINNLISELKVEKVEALESLKSAVAETATTVVTIATPVETVVETPRIESPDQTDPLVPQQTQPEVSPGTTQPLVLQAKPKDNVQSMPMMNDDLGMNLVNTGVI